MSVAFTSAGARSAAVTGALAMLLIVETAGLHLLLWRLMPRLAWGLTALSLYALWWLLTDYITVGRVGLRLDATTLHVHVGRRLRASIPRAAIVSATRPTWRDLGAAAPPPQNATKPASPNVLLVFTAPQPVRVLGMLPRSIERLSVHLDDPEAFLTALAAPATAGAPSAGAPPAQ